TRPYSLQEGMRRGRRSDSKAGRQAAGSKERNTGGQGRRIAAPLAAEQEPARERSVARIAAAAEAERTAARGQAGCKRLATGGPPCCSIRRLPRGGSNLAAVRGNHNRHSR